MTALEWQIIGEVSVDKRRRLSLARAGSHKRYRLTERGDGSILMEPLISVLAAHKNGSSEAR